MTTRGEPEFKLIPDKGCLIATKFLGRQSHCLKCPFNSCQEHSYGMGLPSPEKQVRNKQIIELYLTGLNKQEIANQFGLSTTTIRQICHDFR